MGADSTDTQATINTQEQFKNNDQPTDQHKTSPMEIATQPSQVSLPPVVPTHPAVTPRAPGNLEHKKQKYYGKKMSIITLNNQKYMIGVQIAHLLQRETYNLYRSMKVKNLTITRASPEQVDYLLKTNVVKPGTRSITFIPIDQAISYIEEEIKKVGLRKKKDKSPTKLFTVEKTKIKPTSDVKTTPKIVQVKPLVAPPKPLSAPKLEIRTPIAIKPTPIEIKSVDLENPFEVLCAAAEAELSNQTKENQRESNNSPTKLPALARPEPVVPVVNTLPVPLSLKSPNGQALYQPIQICGVSAQNNPLFDYYEQLNKLNNANPGAVPQMWVGLMETKR
eukprot:TRINITY_DN14866_c0_g1_i1.p1 TRINITY_DN14866_c0_g1~~TRINITY_DN14866_c0_g1_i1.p1  ORF type:complete len:336 (+),score=101.27 TRINITY_DN14866_c0_g1_i1:551-1558(+)